jgi:hypothetical protein
MYKKFAQQPFSQTIPQTFAANLLFYCVKATLINIILYYGIALLNMFSTTTLVSYIDYRIFQKQRFYFSYQKTKRLCFLLL